MLRFSHFARLVLVLLLAVTVGCADGPRRASVAGTVSVGGKPLERGVINFIPAEGSHGPGAGGAVTDGQYLLEDGNGAVIGTCRVEIRGFRKTGRKIAPMGTPMDEEIQVVPVEFNDKSTLVRDIKNGDNQLDFVLPAIRDRK
jgi:hypothetical protein